LIIKKSAELFSKSIVKYNIFLGGFENPENLNVFKSLASFFNIVIKQKSLAAKKKPKSLEKIQLVLKSKNLTVTVFRNYTAFCLV